MREFRDALPWYVRVVNKYRLVNELETFKDVFANTSATDFGGVGSVRVYQEAKLLAMRCKGDLSVFELFLWLLDRRHFVMWQYASEALRNPELASGFRASYEHVWRETSRLVRSDGRIARPLRRPEWPSIEELRAGRHFPTLLDAPLRAVDSRLLANASAEFNASSSNRTFELSINMHRAARDIVASNRDYSKPPAAFDCFYESIAGPTLVAAPPTFPYRPKGVHTW